MPQPSRPNRNNSSWNADHSARSQSGDSIRHLSVPNAKSQQIVGPRWPSINDWESSSTAIIQLDLDGNVVQLNDAARQWPLSSIELQSARDVASLNHIDPYLVEDLRTAREARRSSQRIVEAGPGRIGFRRLQLFPHVSMPLTGFLVQYRHIADKELSGLGNTALWNTLTQLSMLAFQAPGLAEFVAAVTAAVGETLQASAAEVWRLRPELNKLQLYQAWGWPQPVPPCDLMADDPASVVATAFASVHTLTEHHVPQSPRISQLPADAQPQVSTGVYSQIAGEDQSYGVLGVGFSRHRELTADEHQFLQAVSHLLAETIQRTAIQSELRDIQNRLEFTLNTARIGTWTLRLDDLTAIRSPRHDEIFGYTEALPEWTYAMFLDHVVAEDRESVNRILEAGIREKSSWRFECRICRADGELRWISVEGTTIRGHDNSPDAMTGLVVDITERKEAELSLRATEERLRLATEATDLGTWDLDPETGKMIVSDRFRLIWRIPVGTPVTYDSAVSMIHPDDRMPVRIAVQNSLNPRESGHYDVEHRLVVPPGEPDRWVRATGRVYFDKHHATRFVGTVEDITADKRAQQAIAERLKLAERLNHIAQTVPGLIYSFEIDEHGLARFPFVGPQVNDMFGVSAEELRRDAAGVFSRVHPEDIERLRESIETSRNTGGEWHEQYRYHHPLRGEVWLEAKSAPQYRVSGPVVWHGFVQDITEQKHAELELAAAQRAAEAASRSKSEFLANMSHEIRTPMTAILGYTDLLDERERDPQKAKFLRIIRRNGRYLLDILNDILDISKIEAGKFELDQEQIKLAPLISDVYAMMYVRAEEKGVKLLIEFESQLPETIVSDSKRLRQILINLLSNAIKFTSEGYVKLVTRYEASEIPQMILEVSDSGIGISPELLPRLFEPFFQGDASVTRQFGGTGLGLAISQRLANMLGGTISVESEPGQGSSFTFRFAAQTPSDAIMIQPRLEATEDEQADSLPTPQLACRILVVDDRRDVRYLVRYILLKAGATVEMAEDGLEAIDMVSQTLAHNHPYDLILLDMQMPRLDGYQAAPRLRGLGFAGPIIALTADVLEQDKTNCLTQGCTAFLRKPIDARELLVLVDQLTQ